MGKKNDTIVEETVEVKEEAKKEEVKKEEPRKLFSSPEKTKGTRLS